VEKNEKEEKGEKRWDKRRIKRRKWVEGGGVGGER